MKRMKKAVLIVLMTCCCWVFNTPGWAQFVFRETTNPEGDLYAIFDIILVRPAAALAGVAGVGFVILSLPFTIPTKSVDQGNRNLRQGTVQFRFFSRVCRPGELGFVDQAEVTRPYPLNDLL